MDFFENMLHILADKNTFYVCKIIKRTSGFKLKKTKFFARWRQHPKNSWIVFSNTNNSTTLTPPGPQGCLEKPNYPLSSSLVVWFTNIGSETKKLPKSFKNPSFFWYFDAFLLICNLLGLEPHLCTLNHQISSQWIISLL